MSAILITGIMGQDGTLLTRRLLAEGHEVHGVVLSLPHTSRWQADGFQDVTLHTADVSDSAQVQQVMEHVRPSEVYNLAGVSSVAASWADPVGTARATGVGAVIVYAAAHRLQERSGGTVRVVQASSAEIFGRADRSPQDEMTPVRPVSPYGAAKAFAHHTASVYRSLGLHVSSCILFNHESPLRPESFVTRKIAKGAARIAADGTGVLTLGNLDTRRDWGWAQDFVDCMVRAARHDVPDDFVVATGETHTVGDFARIAFEYAGVSDWRSRVKVDARFVRPIEAAEQVGDAGKAARELGWRPSVGFEELVRRMVEHDLSELRSG